MTIGRPKGIPAHNRTHGMTGSPEYKIYYAMLGRCHVPSDTSYSKYGAMGVAVCARWRESFANFYADMGPRPGAGYSIDRIDNSKGYEPGNCRWATAKEQCLNRRNQVWLTVGGERRRMCEWAELRKIPYRVIQQRRRAYGWDDERAVNTPWGGATVRMRERWARAKRLGIPIARWKAQRDAARAAVSDRDHGDEQDGC